VNLLDWLLVAAVVLFGLAGWHRGFLAGVLSFAGFIGGGLLAAFLLPSVLESAIETAWLRVAVLGSAILFSALLGQFVASILGGRLRGAIGWHPVRLVDNAAGAALNVLALAVVAWIVPMRLPSSASARPPSCAAGKCCASMRPPLFSFIVFAQASKALVIGVPMPSVWAIFMTNLSWPKALPPMAGMASAAAPAFTNWRRLSANFAPNSISSSSR